MRNGKRLLLAGNQNTPTVKRSRRNSRKHRPTLAQREPVKQSTKGNLAGVDLLRYQRSRPIPMVEFPISLMGKVTKIAKVERWYPIIANHSWKKENAIMKLNLDLARDPTLPRSNLRASARSSTRPDGVGLKLLICPLFLLGVAIVMTIWEFRACQINAMMYIIKQFWILGC